MSGAPERPNNIFASFVPGFMQGVTRATVSFPFDVVKVISQTENISITNAFASTIKQQPSLLFRGYPVAALGVGLERSLSFFLFEKLLAQNKEQNKYISAVKTAIPCSLISVPMMSITSNVVAMDGRSGSVSSHIRNNARTHGMSFFFRAYHWEVARSVAVGTLFMGTYAQLRSVLPESKKSTAVSGVVAGWTAWLVQYPWDTLRTIYQTDKSANVSLKTTLTTRLQQGGVLSLYRGLPVVLLRTVPSSMFGMLVYEWARKRVSTDGNLK